MSKYIRLNTGEKIEYYDLYITNACVIKFLNIDVNTINNFFGDKIIDSFDLVEVLNGKEEIIESKTVSGLKKTNVRFENGTISTFENILVSEEYEETDSNGNIILHPAKYNLVEKKEEAIFTIVTLSQPSLNEQLNDIRKYLDIPNKTNLNLNEWKDYKQNLNKNALKEFLSIATVEFNGKQYGVTEDDQNEMALNYMQYQISKQAGIEENLEWHAKKEKCVEFTEEEFLKLTILVKSFVYPYMNQMQEYKEKIYACNSIEDVKEIKFNYSVKESE